MKDLTPERLTRLLALITYFADGRQVPFGEAAQHFGITTDQLLSDINTLWVSGAPGYTHAELIDFEAEAFDQGLVSLREAQRMDIPLRLSASESVALLIAVNSLIARLGETDVLLNTKHKLQHAAGQAAIAAEAVHIDRTAEATKQVRDEVQAAIVQGKQVEIRYVSGTDDVTTRRLDPLLLASSGDHWLLTAWCYRAESLRHFRLDRVLKLTVLDSLAQHHHVDSIPGEMPTDQFQHRVALHLEPTARWVVEQIPVEEVEEHGDGSFTVELAVADPAWVEQLCLSLGAAVRAIEPESLAMSVRDLAGRALDAYDALRG